MTEEFNNLLKQPLLDETVKQRNDFLFCCLSDEFMKWWFFHSTPTGITVEYKETDVFLCYYLDCCSTCLELNFTKTFLCKERTICFMLCCSFTFE
jgi:hypothetical protein